MSDTTRIRRAATVLLIIIGVVLLLFVIQLVRAIILNTEGSGWNAFTITNYIVGTLIVLVLLFFCSSLLYSIRKDETPFCTRNVNKLKAIAVLLAVYEPYDFIVQRLINKFIPIVLGDGSLIVVESSLGGVVFVSGLVIYCVALVFQYGISLQSQVDETL